MNFKFLVPLAATVIAMHSARADQARFLVTNQDALQARVDIIQQARHEILVEYFSVWNDDQSVGGMALLGEAARRGVKVKIIMDALSSKVPEPLVQAVEDSGRDAKGNKNLEIKFYNETLLNPTKVTHRDHAKMLIIDGEILLTGSRNIGDKYFGTNPKRNYNDLDILVRGSVANQARSNYLAVWESKIARDPALVSQFRKKLDPQYCMSEEDFQSCTDRQKQSRWIVAKQQVRLERFLHDVLTPQPDDLVHANTGTDWMKGATKINEIDFLSHKPDELVNRERAFLSQELLAAVKQAKNDVNFVSPYLIPTPETLQAFRELTARGVRVRVITNSLKSTDTAMAHAGYVYKKSELVKAGVEIYEYAGPDTLHAKTAVIDHDRVFVGSYNVDPRSAFINREVGISFYDPRPHGLASDLESIIENFRANSVLVAKKGVEYNLEWQEQGVSFAKRRLVNSFLISMPVLINQL